MTVNPFKWATRAPEPVAPQRVEDGRVHRPSLGQAGGGRRWLAAALALLVAAAVVVAIVGSISSSPSRRSSSSSASVSGATTVQRRDLVATDTESGTLSHADPHTVYDRLSGTITWLPSVGQLIKPGQTLYEVDGAPVILMDGSTPAYRDLTASDSAGRDIRQLNRNLVALGLNPDGIVIDDTWQAATTAGVDAFQASLGETETGTLSLGQIVFVPGKQRVTHLEATLGDGGGSGAASPSAATNSPSGGGGAAPTAILQTTSTRLVATVDLDASKQSEAKVGERVTVEMPNGGTVNGVISAVSPVAQTSSSNGNGNASGGGNGNGNGSSSAATIPVTIKLKGHVRGAGLDQAPVSVNFIQAVAKGVLSVPVTALLATPGGGYAVQQATVPGKLIAVTTGLFAAGYVQISGQGAYSGLNVTNSQG